MSQVKPIKKNYQLWDYDLNSNKNATENVRNHEKGKGSQIGRNIPNSISHSNKIILSALPFRSGTSRWLMLGE